MTGQTQEKPTANAAPADGEEGASTFLRTILLWSGLWVAIQAVSWGAGIPRARLERAIEAGAAEVERRAVGEVGEDDIREAIAMQRDTLPFFRALAILGDFVVGPLALGARAVCVAIFFAGLAALVGRPIGFGKGLEEAAAAQVFWVAGLAVQTGLAILLGRAVVETSATLLLNSGPQPATVWVTLRQLDLFALLGWLALARGAWKRGQASMLGAAACVLLLGSAEALLRIGAELVLGGWMRLSLLPESFG